MLNIVYVSQKASPTLGFSLFCLLYWTAIKFFACLFFFAVFANADYY